MSSPHAQTFIEMPRIFILFFLALALCLLWLWLLLLLLLLFLFLLLGLGRIKGNGRRLRFTPPSSYGASRRGPGAFPLQNEACQCLDDGIIVAIIASRQKKVTLRAQPARLIHQALPGWVRVRQRRLVVVFLAHHHAHEVLIPSPCRSTSSSSSSSSSSATSHGHTSGRRLGRQHPHACRNDTDHRGH